MSRTTEELLRESLVHFDQLLDHARRDLTDQLVLDAVCLRLAAGIEVLARLEPSVREDLFPGDWTAMWSTRNRIAHGYLLISADIIRATVAEDVPHIVATIRDAITQEQT